MPICSCCRQNKPLEECTNTFTCFPCIRDSKNRDAVLNDLIAERDRLREFVKDMMWLLEYIWKHEYRAFGPQSLREGMRAIVDREWEPCDDIEDRIFDLAARAEAILEDK